MPKILVVLDPEEDFPSSLSRIEEIPVSESVEFKVDWYINPATLHMLGQAELDSYVEERKRWVDRLIAPLAGAGYKISSEVILFTRLYEAIFLSAERFGADFVFKPFRQHTTIRRAFFTSTDWNLIRLCSKPVLMVSDNPDVHGKPVIAAVRVGSEGKIHRQLNETVMEEAMRLASVVEAEVHLVHAYGPPMVASTTRLVDPLAYQISRDKYRDNLIEAQQLARTHDVPLENVHLREGIAATVLVECAREFGAAVIVMGSVGRRGAAGLLVGNTAEATLEKTRCDILVVKHPSLRSRILAVEDDRQ